MTEEEKEHSELEPPQPSEDFLKLLCELKDEVLNLNTENKTDEELQQLEKKQQTLYDLGRRDGLSFRDVSRRIDEDRIEVGCKQCGKKITIQRHHEEICHECLDKRKRLEWEQYCEEERKNETPIQRYCYAIRGKIPDYRLKYDETHTSNQEYNSNSLSSSRIETASKYMDDEARFSQDNPPPELNMTKTQWDIVRKKLKKRSNIAWKEHVKMYKDDFKLTHTVTPKAILGKIVDEIGCECTAEGIRKNEWCTTCKLLVSVHEYTMRLFERFAQGKEMGK